MSIDDIGTGSVIRYSYLWAREAENGETEGRKDRPVCVQLIFSRAGRRVAMLFPITSRPPASGMRALAVPRIEAQRAGLDVPAWIVINEQNEDYLPKSPYLISSEPLGRFSNKFMEILIKAVIASLKEGGHRRTSRE